VLRSSLALVALALLGACATLSEPPETQVAGGFELSGRVAVRYAKEGASGRIAWRHAPQSDELLITSVLGQGLARLRRTGQDIELFANGREYRATDAEALTEEVLGWRIPLDGLPYWVQGQAAPGSEAQMQREDSGRLTHLRQDGWSVEYQEYQAQRPLRMRLSRPELEIRLIVDEWRT
jgi:outer membrane lipoprotein LolB